MRLKPSGLRCVDISGNFNAVLRFCYAILYGVYIPAFLSGFAVFFMLFCTVFIPVFLCRFAVFVPSLRPPLFRLLSDLKFYYMHVKVSCKGTDTEADLSVLIHATSISST